MTATHATHCRRLPLAGDRPLGAWTTEAIGIRLVAPAPKARGLALIAVLWAVALLSLMAGSFALTLQRETGLLNTLQGQARARALAEAGLDYTILMLTLPDPAQRWHTAFVWRELHLPGGVVRLRVLDEGGKIDINGAQEATWRALLTGVLGDPDRAAALSDAILDWRDPDALKRLHGAEAEDYAAAGKPYSPGNRPFQSLEELNMVLGMTPALYDRLVPSLTLHTGVDGINPDHATRATLLALTGLDEKTVDTYLQQRAATPPGTPLAPHPLTSATVPLHQIQQLAYGVELLARSEDGAIAGLKAVLRPTNMPGALPLTVVEWQIQAVGEQQWLATL